MAELVRRWRDLPPNYWDAIREKAVRSLLCPCCPAPPGEACQYDPDFVGGLAARYAHAGRYDRAARALLVPAMAGRRG